MTTHHHSDRNEATVDARARPSTDCNHPSRRRVLGGAAALGAAALAGCLSGEEGPAAEPAEPIALTDGQACAVCGMVIDDHFGPAGQVFYGEGGPDDHDDPVPFDSVAELLVFHGEQVAAGATTRGVFVTDYSLVDYDLEEREGTPYVSRHAEREAFADATDLSFVVDSAVEGAMGADHVPFSDESEAAAFADDHGGEVRAWDDLDPAV